MTPEDITGWRERAAWALAGGVAATIYQLSHDYAGGTLTRKLLVMRLGSIPLILLLSAALVSSLNLPPIINGVVTTLMFMVGRDGLDYFARATAAKWLGVPVPPTRVFAAPGTATLIPSEALDTIVESPGKMPSEIVVESLNSVAGEEPQETEDAAIRKLLQRIRRADD